MQDIIEQLGPLALASRLKRLYELLIKDAEVVYKDQDIDFQPHWFPVFYLLNLSGKPMSITEIATSLNLTHPGIIKISKSMAEKGLVKSLKDKKDARKHLIELSEKAKKMIPELQSIWECFEKAMLELIVEIDYDLIDVLTKIDKSLNKKSSSKRILKIFKEKQMSKIEILEYNSEYNKHFKSLNYEWLEKYFKIENYDEKILSNPEKEIIEKGGFILFAQLNGKIVGTCAMEKINESTFELSKLAVTQSAQGKQVGKKLLSQSIERLRESGVERIFLQTDRKLQNAYNLYIKMGFKFSAKNKLIMNNYERSQYSLIMKLDLN